MTIIFRARGFGGENQIRLSEAYWSFYDIEASASKILRFDLPTVFLDGATDGNEGENFELTHAHVL